MSEGPTLPEKYVSHGCVDVIVGWLSGVDHQTIHELHGFGSLSTQFSGHNDLTSLSSRLHDETEYSVACSVKDEHAS